MGHQLPVHLQKYIVTQNYEKYTPMDHAVWRYVLRQLRSFLGKHAHESYLEGLEKTGISVEKIPSIESISKKLEEFGWRALPVSGFIPPAAFMELQSLGVLPIASDMRSIDHLLYTPAPDIVHEAAGHAPILVQPEYAEYLRQYAQVAKKAILSKQDLDQYEAIRHLSDVKENPNSTPEDIQQAEKRLTEVNNSITYVSEAAELGRMNWWTAEYGLIGDMKNPKIFGAGLLSSVGEAKFCLSEKVRKLPLTVDCIKQAYDITEPQPQLFVSKDFNNLVEVLHQMADQMAFKLGGTRGLDKIIKAQSVNTAQLDSGLQISGVHTRYILDDQNKIAYLQFSGPTQISFQDKQVEGHDKSYHKEGYGTPVGELASHALNDLVSGRDYTVKYKSGVTIQGHLDKVVSLSPTAKILTFSKATASYKDQTLFQPEWGFYDVVTGTDVVSVFGGAADRISYGDMDDFMAAKVPTPQYSEEQRKLFANFQAVRDLRLKTSASEQDLRAVLTQVQTEASENSAQWLLFLELLEITIARGFSEGVKTEILNHLHKLSAKDEKVKNLIDDGLALAHEIT